MNFKKNYNKKVIGLDRDDVLAIIRNLSGSKAEKIKEDVQKLFIVYHLNITTQCNLKIVNYLDVTLSSTIFLMLHADLFASPTTKSHMYIRNQTNLYLF